MYNAFKTRILSEEIDQTKVNLNNQTFPKFYKADNLEGMETVVY